MRIIQAIASFVAKQKISTLHVHPFVRMRGSSQSEPDEWERLLAPMQPFQQEAYDQQSEVRMLIFPIIEPQKSLSVEAILSASEFFRERLAKPSFYFHGTSPLNPATIVQNDLRGYINQMEETTESIISQMWINHVFQSVLEKMENGSTGLIEPCQKHLIIEENPGLVYSCFDQWLHGKPFSSLDRPEEVMDNLRQSSLGNCAQCISHSCLMMKDNLKANGKSEESQRFFLDLGMAFSERGDYTPAAMHARTAFEFSSSDADRATALLHQGLCHLKLMELERAEEAFKEGAAYSNDPSLFSYHQGCIHFARQNYIEAINLFEQALGNCPPEVSLEDLLFNLAISHINIENFSRARFHLDRMHGVSAPVYFYRGICDFGEGMVQMALIKFGQALDLGPAPDDLSRVRFYIGTCLKELERYDEAIAELQRAVEADPRDYMNYNLLGFCLYQTKQYEKAIASFHKAIKLNPFSAIDYASIGTNLRELGRLEEAIEMYEKALSLDPAISAVRENIVKLNKALATGQTSEL
ncbi:MAG: tetratricopeptide repeat protein [Chloroflexota bacterium]|nr:tetratricopeptide repeat protein [Chloroflexota bacterium]